MGKTVVSILETFKRPRVSAMDLPEMRACRIVRFMRHDIEIGRLIASLRKEKGVTVERLGDVVSVEKGTMSKKLRGQLSFSDVELEKLCRFFGMEKWKLYALAAGVDPEKLEFADAYDVVTPGFRKDIIRMSRERGGSAVGE